MLELNWKDISARLKDLRIKNKITIERLSEIIGVSTSFVGLVERGDSGISIENLYKLSQVFGVSVDYLLTGEATSKAESDVPKFDILKAALYDYTEDELSFLLDLAKFLKPRVNVVKSKKK